MTEQSNRTTYLWIKLNAECEKLSSITLPTLPDDIYISAPKPIIQLKRDFFDALYQPSLERNTLLIQQRYCSNKMVAKSTPIVIAKINDGFQQEKDSPKSNLLEITNTI